MSKKLEFNIPGPDAPGYLKRMRQVIRFTEIFSGGAPKASDIDAIVDFLVDYVSVPEDRDEARAALWEASQAQFMELLEALAGGGDSTVPPASGGS